MLGEAIQKSSVFVVVGGFWVCVRVHSVSNIEAWLPVCVGESEKKVNGDVCDFYWASQPWPWFQNSNETRSAPSRTIKTGKEGEKNYEDKNKRISRYVKIKDRWC